MVTGEALAYLRDRCLQIVARGMGGLSGVGGSARGVWGLVCGGCYILASMEELTLSLRHGRGAFCSPEVYVCLWLLCGDAAGWSH